MLDSERPLHDDLDPNESDLADVPRVFRHAKCGGETRLGASSVRRYLRDPLRLAGVGSSVTCSACQRRCHSASCHWVDSGENVELYYRRLIGRACELRPFAWIGRFALLYGSLSAIAIGGAALAVLHQGGTVEQVGLVARYGAAFLAVLLFVAFLVRWVKYRNCVTEYLEATGTSSRAGTSENRGVRG